MLNLSAVNPDDAKRCCLQKKQYSNKAKARDAAALAKKRSGLVQHAYRCLVCGEFHLTTQPKAADAGIRRTLRNRKNQPGKPYAVQGT